MTVHRPRRLERALARQINKVAARLDRFNEFLMNRPPKKKGGKPL